MNKEKNTALQQQASPAAPTQAPAAPEPGAPARTGQTDAEAPHDPSATRCAPETGLAGPTTDELIRQAYLRGRNEAIDELMRQPSMLQPLDSLPRKRENSAAQPEIMILNSPRPSIWDK